MEGCLGRKFPACLSDSKTDSRNLHGCNSTNYWMAKRGWNWEALRDLLLAMTLLCMESIIIGDMAEEEYKLAWSKSTDGEFLVSSSYDTCCDQDQTQS